ncbi:MAG: ABC transporter permease [Lachnospiraceae bacterium]|nr:ABC transporter permease [Lachnospiraceae bacterium]
MASYLVMKNNLNRALKRKSTYLIVLVVPILLAFIGSVSVRLPQSKIRVGIVGDSDYIQKMEEQLKLLDKITFQIADIESIHTDVIMGKYHFVLNQKDLETEQNSILNKVKEASENKMFLQTNDLTQTQRMISMMLTTFMIVATLYTMKYLKDTRDGAVERFCYTGHGRINYLCGYGFSTSVITGIQIVLILSIWMVFDKNFSISISKGIAVFLFLLIVSNLYGIFITLISKSDLMAGVLSTSIAILFAILGGTFVAVSNMPGCLQMISRISPMRWLMEML